MFVHYPRTLFTENKVYSVYKYFSYFRHQFVDVTFCRTRSLCQPNEPLFNCAPTISFREETPKKKKCLLFKHAEIQPITLSAPVTVFKENSKFKYEMHFVIRETVRGESPRRKKNIPLSWITHFIFILSSTSLELRNEETQIVPGICHLRLDAYASRGIVIDDKSARRRPRRPSDRATFYCLPEVSGRSPNGENTVCHYFDRPKNSTTGIEPARYLPNEGNLHRRCFYGLIRVNWFNTILKKRS